MSSYRPQNTPSFLSVPKIEWPTVGIGLGCYAGFAISTGFAETLGCVCAALLLVVSLTLYSSFHHEVLHGHPFRSAWLNTLFAFCALGLFVPYERFKSTHLAHHRDPLLTDPYEDPETNYIDPDVWAGWSRLRRAVYLWNNTMAGRVLIGPMLGLYTFYRQDLSSVLSGDRGILRAYVLHAVGLIPVVMWWMAVSEMSLWLYLLCAYASHSILKIRTFLEHQAHEQASHRTVIIEDRGLLSFLFLRNNLHAVHHLHPGVPWYRLQAVFLSRRAEFLAQNGGYTYPSYADVCRRFLFRSKDEVPHYLWKQGRLFRSDTTHENVDRQVQQGWDSTTETDLLSHAGLEKSCPPCPDSATPG